MFAKSEPIVVSFCPRPLRAATMEEARRAREEYVAKLKQKKHWTKVDAAREYIERKARDDAKLAAKGWSENHPLRKAIREAVDEASERVAAYKAKRKRLWCLTGLAALAIGNLALLPVGFAFLEAAPVLAAVTLLAVCAAVLAWPVARLLDVLFDR